MDLDFCRFSRIYDTAGLENYKLSIYSYDHITFHLNRRLNNITASGRCRLLYVDVPQL